MLNTIKVKKSDPLIRDIVAATFPKYNGRKFSIEATTKVSLGHNYWDGGTRHFKAFVSLENMQAKSLHSNHPFFERTQLGAGYERAELPQGVAMVEHTIFCGHDMGITIYVHPDNMARLLPRPLTQ